ncbi:hypothetical protein NQ318_016432 [Aromia moschata]|uniref:Transposase n=1 Tax=Aromia moschata TaxID=1265417 RepID=A0AAV8Z413_9CUCU|nr:hypothetical protein NQ318_016432 [Aromia moschata]
MAALPVMPEVGINILISVELTYLTSLNGKFMENLKRTLEEQFGYAPRDTPNGNSDNTVATVLQYFEDHPRNSIRQVCRELNLKYSSVRKILKKNGYHDYKLHNLEHLSDPQQQRRINYVAQVMVNLEINDNWFFHHVLWTDESRFVSNEQLPVLLENVPLQLRANMCFLHDGAPPHKAEIVRQYLNETYGENWIGINEPIPWAPKSPDLTPLDFLTPSVNLERLKEKIRNACNELSREMLRKDSVR